MSLGTWVREQTHVRDVTHRKPQQRACASEQLMVAPAAQKARTALSQLSGFAVIAPHWRHSDREAPHSPKARL
jgi:hypothetical protein